MNTTNDWERRLERWLAPFLQALGHKVRRKWAPIYVLGLLLPGERKSIEPISARVAPDDEQQLNHFIGVSTWDTAPLEHVLCEKVDAMLGGSRAHLIIDDTGIPKKGKKSVGVAHQYCGALGKNANSQNLVSLTLSRDEIAAPLGLRLFLPQSWTSDRKRCATVKVPTSIGYRSKWRIALVEIDRVISSGVRFGDVLADAGYGMCGEFRRELSARGLTWSVGILCTQNVYDPNTSTSLPVTSGRGRPRKRAVASKKPQSAADYIEQNGTFESITWRHGTKGPLTGDFAIARILPADGSESDYGVHLPGESAWLICERRPDEKKYYLSNLPATASKHEVVSAIKARWACELAHQQLKEELGLDHYEGRSWHGLHHHALFTMIAFAFLQENRIRENKSAA